MTVLEECIEREINFARSTSGGFTGDYELKRLSNNQDVTYRLEYRNQAGIWLEIASRQLKSDLPALVMGIDKVYPNPFNPVTKISYTVAESSTVRLAVYNVHG